MADQLMKLGDMAEFMNGGAWSQAEYSDQGVPVVRVSDIDRETIDLSACKYLPPSSLKRYEKHLLAVGDLLICTVGSHPSQPGSVVGNMRRALPNAAFIAFTGTPLIATDAEKTKEVFGD